MSQRAIELSLICLNKGEHAQRICEPTRQTFLQTLFEVVNLLRSFGLQS